MYFYSRNNFINDFFCYILYFLFVLARKSQFTIFFPFTMHKVYNSTYVKTFLANVSIGFMGKEGNRISNNLFWVRSGKDTSEMIY